ncbi:hypothetical protein C0431_09275 [bacterium]|nr:hypothetical protein [bacterium]
MKVAIFGATGRTGRLLLNDAVERGWEVSILVRDPAKLSANHEISVFVGDSRSLHSVNSVIQGVDAVFSCLAVADISGPATDLSDCIKTIVEAMGVQGIKRIIHVGSAGELDHPGGGYRNQEGLPDYLQYVSIEQVRCYEALRESGLDWTVMCPSWLQEDIPVGKYRYEIEDLPDGSEETGYADLARLMVEMVDRPESIRQRVGIVSFR